MALMDDPQREVIAFLRDAASYLHAGPPPELGEEAEPGAVEVVETHCSLVFLAGDYGCKLKRAVRYAYLDFSTLARRHAACLAELTLNRRTAPQLYLDVRAIRRLPEGGLAWDRGAGGEPGEIVDFVVVMRRFASDALLDRVAQAGQLTPALLYALAAHIAAFHDKAEERPDRGGAAVMGALAHTNLEILRGCGAAGFAPAQIDRIGQALGRELARIETILERRRQAGAVRHGHGALHLRNICLLDGQPMLFDCVEFAQDLATVDVLYDLAFLLMDLGLRDRADFANLVLNRYLDLRPEEDGLAAMPLFMALRAIIRAHVTATMAEHGWGAADGIAEAGRYLDEAEAVLRPCRPRLVAIGGLSGSGKSTLAARLAQHLAPCPGARVLRSDVLRKLRCGREPEAALPAEAYTPDMSALVYRELGERASAALAAGYPVIIDAVALRQEERGEFAALARAAGVPFTGLWLEAPAWAMATRLASRRGDASDASETVLRQQLAQDAGPLVGPGANWLRINAAGTPEETLAAATRALAG
jgi:hypothetical protein